MGILKDKKAVIFDLDGTVVDSLGVWSDVDMRLAQVLGVKDPDRQALNRLREASLTKYRNDAQPYTRFCGEFGKYAGSPLTAEEIHAARYKISREVLKTEVKLKAGVADVIRAVAAAGLRMCVATTTKKANVDIYSDVNEAIRSELKIKDYFEFFITIEDVDKIKPDPQCYLLALKRLGVSADEALIIEDSLAGTTAAKAAGIDVVVVRESHSEGDRSALMRLATHYYENFAELRKAL